MASDAHFIEYILDQLQEAGEVDAKKMFGQYGLYFDGIFFGFVFDNRLFLKPTEAGKAFMKEVSEDIPYPGAKPQLLIEEQLEDREWLAEMIHITVAALSPPKK